MTDDQLKANNRRRLFGGHSWPAAGDIYAHTTPNRVKLMPIYERVTGQAAACIANLTPIIASIGHERL